MLERLAPEQHDTIPEVPEPAENPHLVGHEDAATAVAGAHRAGKLHHGLLIGGPQGIGKATFAFHVAHHLLRHPDAASAPETLAVPDPSTALWRQIASGAHPSVLYLTRPVNERGKGFRTAVTAEEVRRVGRFLSRTAHDGGFRVVIVDPADDMNRHAANALLKNLEEPPAKTVFVLVAHQPGRLLPTIRSRCQFVRLHPLGPPDMRRVMSTIGGAAASISDDALERAGGRPRAALLDVLFGGGEIAETTDRLLAQRPLDNLTLHKLADAVCARDAAVQFALFNDHLLETVARAARGAASQARSGEADRLSALWQATAAARIETETYNLDRKQHVLTTVARVHAELAPGT
jgi:DNA polymerase III subunit delta'